MHGYFETSQEVTEIRVVQVGSLQNLTTQICSLWSPYYHSVEYKCK